MKVGVRSFGVVVWLAVATSACGGGSTPSAPSKAAFIERADRLCAEANEKLDDLPEPRNIEQFGTVLETGSRITRELLADLRALGTPAEDRQTLATVYLLVEQGLAKFEAALAAVRSGDAQTVVTLAEEGQALFEQANTASETYGFKDCAE